MIILRTISFKAHKSNKSGGNKAGCYISNESRNRADEYIEQIQNPKLEQATTFNTKVHIDFSKTQLSSSDLNYD